MQPVLIAGAGPTGLAAALFLSRADVTCRIIDKSTETSSWSKALAVNPRTLELLQDTDVTPRILGEGRAIERVRVEALSEMMRGQGVWAAARQIAPGLATGLPQVRRMMEEMVTGEDHLVKLS